MTARALITLVLAAVLFLAGPGVAVAAPSAPAGLKGEPGKQQIRLTWTPNRERDIVGYYLFEKIGPLGTWNYIDTTTDSKYLRSGLVDGTAYSYYLRAFNYSSETGPASTEVSASPSNTAVPFVPLGLAARGDDGKVLLDWDDSPESDIGGYYVFRKVSANGAWGYDGSSTTSSYVSSSAINGTGYSFYLRAYNTSGGTSTYSSEAAAVASAYPTRFPVGVVGNSDFASTSMMAVFQALGSPSVRAEWDVSVDPATLGPTFSSFGARGVRPLVLAGFPNRVPAEADVTRFCSGIAQRFGPGGSAQLPASSTVKFIEFGNESSYSYQGETYNDPEDYASRLSTCATAARQANPAVGVIGQADDPNNVHWVYRMFSSVPSLGSAVSGWSTHPYGPESRADRMIDKVRDQTALNGSTAPIYVTEYGLATDNGRSLSDNYGWPVNQTYAQASTALVGTVDRWKVKYPRMGSLYYYSTKDLSVTGTSTDRERYFGLVHPDGVPKEPLYGTVKGLIFTGL